MSTFGLWRLTCENLNTVFASHFDWHIFLHINWPVHCFPAHIGFNSDPGPNPAFRRRWIRTHGWGSNMAQAVNNVPTKVLSLHLPFSQLRRLEKKLSSSKTRKNESKQVSSSKTKNVFLLLVPFSLSWIRIKKRKWMRIRSTRLSLNTVLYNQYESTTNALWAGLD